MYRQCTYHCTQILTARLLLFLTGCRQVVSYVSFTITCHNPLHLVPIPAKRNFPIKNTYSTHGADPRSSTSLTVSVLTEVLVLAVVFSNFFAYFFKQSLLFRST